MGKNGESIRNMNKNKKIEFFHNQSYTYNNQPGLDTLRKNIQDINSQLKCLGYITYLSKNRENGSLCFFLFILKTVNNVDSET